MTLKTNLRGQVRQTTLPKWKSLLPLFEAIMNAYQAIEEADKNRVHSIVIDCEREATLALDPDEETPFINFTIKDTGVGFNDTNFDSFNTTFSEHKFSRGGKGLGRLMWLVAFEKADIESFFREPDTDHPWRRSFSFDTNYDPDDATPIPVDDAITGTTVHLRGFRSPYKDECPRTAEALAQRIIEHFILVLLRPDCPEITLNVDGITHSIKDIFKTTYQVNASEHAFEVSGSKFKMHGFKIVSPRANKHRLIYSANSRGVLTENLDDFIPNLSSKLTDSDGNQFVYLAIVKGDYLDQRVNNIRTDFEISGSDAQDAEAQMSLLPAEVISKADIRAECLKAVQATLGNYIASLNEAKVERIFKYVKEEAPQYKPLMRYRDEFIDSIKPNASKIEIEMILHHELHKKEVGIKRESAKLISGAEKIDDYETYKGQLSDFIERYSELGTAALAHHVMHRKIIIDLLERALSANVKDGKYPLEEVVHNIVFPMRSTDQETLYSQQNLWLIDERLTFHTYIASDKKLSAHDNFDSTSKLRPDVMIFDRKVSFSEPTEDKAPINSVVVIEFKKPMRDDYTEEKNPLDQVFEQIGEIRSGRFKDDAGRYIATANSKIPAFAYVICDITEKLAAILRGRDATQTPDGRAWYGYHRNFEIYYEVIDYNKVVSDARKRNRIFFDRLKIN
jgi:hypothetical protein